MDSWALPGGVVPSNRDKVGTCAVLGMLFLKNYMRLTHSLGAHVPKRYRMAISNADCELLGVGSGDICGGGDHG